MSLSMRQMARGVVAAVCLIVLAVPQSIAATSAPFRILTYAKNPIVWQRFGSWLMITEDLPNKGRTCYYLSPTRASRLSLKEPLPGEWQPLGSAIKWLMYMDKVDGVDRLMAHDVDWHAYYVARSSKQVQVGCGMVDTRCIFGQYRPFKIGEVYPVDLYCLDMIGGALTVFCMSSSEKSDFAHDGNLLVYRARYPNGEVRIMGHYFDGAREFEIAARDGVGLSVCGNLVAWAERAGSGWDIMAKDISTGEVRKVIHTIADPPRPQAGKGSIFWQDARKASTTGIDIYGYDWNTRKEFVVAATREDDIKLRVCGDMVTWASGRTYYQSLFGAYIK